jgi:hypothetical protein
MDRAVLSGRHSLNFFASTQHASWISLDSVSLGSGDLQHRAPSFGTRPSVESHVAIQLSSDTVAIGASYGISENFELSAIVPLQRVCVSGDKTVQLGGVSQTSIHAEGCTASAGDAQVRIKYSHPVRGWFLGGSGTLFIPSGNIHNLSGRGLTQGALAFLASHPHQPAHPNATSLLNPHLNIGGTVGGHGVGFATSNAFSTPSYILESTSPSQSFDYAIGNDFVFRFRNTISAELRGQLLEHSITFSPFDALNGASLESTPQRWQQRHLVAMGLKHLFGKATTLMFYGGRQLTDSGLKTNLMLGFGVDRRF